MKGIFADIVKESPLTDQKSKQVSTQRERVLDNISPVTVSTFIDEHLNTFVKRDLVELYAAHPEAAFTLPDLEARLGEDRFILLEQLRGLHNAGLIAYHYQDSRTRVWHLVPTEWARWMVRSVAAYWAEHPDRWIDRERWKHIQFIQGGEEMKKRKRQKKQRGTRQPAQAPVAPSAPAATPPTPTAAPVAPGAPVATPPAPVETPVAATPTGTPSVPVPAGAPTETPTAPASPEMPGTLPSSSQSG